LKSLDVSSSKGEVTVKQTGTNATPLGMAIASRYYIKFVSGGILKGDVESAIAAATEGEEKEKGLRKEKKSSKNSSLRSSRESSSAAEGKQKEKKREKKKRKAEETRDDRKEKRRLKRLLEKEMASLQALSVEA
jgi:hypothetical protein